MDVGRFPLAVVLPPIAGAVGDLGSLSYIFYLCAALYFAGAATMLMVPEARPPMTTRTETWHQENT